MDHIMKTERRITTASVGAIMALLVGVSSTPLRAQANPDSIHLRNDCRLATQILRTGNPANKREWALGTIGWCGRDGVDAFVVDWKSKEANADSQTLADMRYSVYNIRDRVLFETLLSTAQSSNSSTRARVEAWYYLLNQVAPAIYISEAELSGDPTRRFCVLDFASASQPTELGPLPPDFVEKVDAAAVQVSTAATDPKVRRFGKCVHDYVASRARMP